MKITHTLIQKFLDNQCTAAEAEAVAMHLEKYPELMGVYMRATWDAADKESTMPAGYTEQMREAISAQIAKHTRVIRFRWMAAAASLLIGTTAVWLFTPKTRTPAQALAKVEKQPEITVNWKTQSNTSAKTWKIKMADGSVVKLAPKAAIRYQEPFGQQEQRNIYMEGQAEFDVAPDKKRPFTVYTKLFSTKALGTSFRVSETTNTSNVKLFHGKVLIKSLMKKLKGWKQDIVLLPGHEMKYSLVEGTVAVNQFNNAAPKQPSPIQNNDYTNQDQDAMVFDNTPLPDVMKALTAKYHSPIFYDEELLKGKYFSGEVLSTDSLSVLLNIIVNMNGLQVAKKEDGYIITQSK